MLPGPTKIFYFNCGIDTLMKRIKNRRRKIEQYYSAEYIEALYFAFLEVASELSDTYKVVEIDTDKLRVPEVVKLYGPSDPN
jgi:deoxyadenosine/deoxycytidine kinase